MDWYKKSAADLQILDSLTDPEARAFMDDYHQKVSISNFFPIDATYDMSAINGTPGNSLYPQSIVDGSDDPRCSLAFCLLAYGYELNESELRNAVSNLGYNLDDYEVIYDFTQ